MRRGPVVSDRGLAWVRGECPDHIALSLAESRARVAAEGLAERNRARKARRRERVRAAVEAAER